MLGGSLSWKQRKTQGALLPIDSEHNAIFQCLEGYQKEHLASITLTAQEAHLGIAP